MNMQPWPFSIKVLQLGHGLVFSLIQLAEKSPPCYSFIVSQSDSILQSIG